MLFLYGIPGILKLALILAAPAALGALVVKLHRGRDPKRTTLFVISAVFAVVEVWLLIEKRTPTLVGNVYDMVAMAPHAAVIYTLGPVGDALWFWWSLSRARRWSAVVPRSSGSKRMVPKGRVRAA